MPLLALLALGMLNGVGCGKAKRATVSGKVTFNNKPVPVGTVSFVDAKNRTGTATIDDKGHYTVTDAPVGEVTIIVNVPKREAGMGGGFKMSKPPKDATMKPPEGMEPSGKGTGAIDPRRIPPIPDKYRSVSTSPLKFTVEPGTQEKDIPLMP